MRYFAKWVKKPIKKNFLALTLGLMFWPFTLMADLEIPATTLGNEKLVMIKAIDTEKRTFVVNMGFEDDIGRYQESLFTTEDLSIRARATQVSRYASLWEVRDPRVKIPFEQSDMVVFSHSLRDVWNDVTRVVAYQKDRREILRRRWSQEKYWTTRFSISRAVSESITETTADQEVKRGGYQAEVMYNFPILGILDYGIGLRLDFERAVQDEPSLEIPTNRFIVMNDFTYSFEPFDSGDFFYISAGIGYGTSQTEVSGDVNRGDVWVLPVAKFGYARIIGSNRAVLLEMVAESLSANEITATETDQRTTIVNAKFSIGLRF